MFWFGIRTPFWNLEFHQKFKYQKNAYLEKFKWNEMDTIYWCIQINRLDFSQYVRNFYALRECGYRCCWYKPSSVNGLYSQSIANVNVIACVHTIHIQFYMQSALKPLILNFHWFLLLIETVNHLKFNEGLLSVRNLLRNFVCIKKQKKHIQNAVEKLWFD